jgi:hypothetical protein
MTNGRQIGASFERKIASMLYDELNIKFRRDLEQYRESLHGDLITDFENFPFVIECKRRSKGTTFSDDWWQQTVASAEHCKKIPVLIYQLNRSPIRCVCDLNVILKAFGGTEVMHQNLVELTFPTFCLIIREMIND